MLKFVKSLGKKSPGSRRSSQDKSGKRSQSICVENDESLTSWLNRHNDDNEQGEAIYIVKDKDLGKLHKAAWYGQLDKVKVLAKRDTSAFDKCHRTPLHLACCRGYASIAQELLAWNARTSVGDKESKTPLMKAVECGHADVVEVLLSYQVDGEARDGNGDTSLHLAVKYLHVPIINALLKAGTNPNLKNMDGKTPLHYAILKEDLKIADILLKNKADVNAIDNKQTNSLMFACQLGNENLVSLLLKKGASIGVKDINGWSASDHALVKGRQVCVKLLENQLRQQQDEDLLKDSTDSPTSGMSSSKVKRENSKGSASASPHVIVGGSSVNRRASMSPRSLLPPPTQTPMMDSTESNAEDSGDETVTFSSHCSQGKDAGSDSWADDTDISLGIDDKKSKGAMRVSLAKFMPKTSDNEDSDLRDDAYAEINFKNGASSFGKSSPTKKQEDTTTSSSSRKGRVSFKEDNEISEVFTSFTNPSPQNKKISSEPDPEPIYATVNKPKKLTIEQQRAFMDELGFSDNDDLTDGSAPICPSPGDQQNHPNNDEDEDGSDWDTTPRSQSEQMSTVKFAAADNDNHQTEDPVFDTNYAAQFGDLQSPSEVFFKNQNTPGKSGIAKDSSIDKENILDSSVPSKCPPLMKRESEEDRCDKTHDDEADESDWDSTVPSGQPTPRNEVTDQFDFQTSGPTNTTSKDENKPISQDRSTSQAVIDGKEESPDIERQKGGQNLNSTPTKIDQVSEPLVKISADVSSSSYLMTPPNNNMVTKKDKDENVDSIMSKSFQSFEGNNQKLASTPKPSSSMPDFPSQKQQQQQQLAVDLTTCGNGLLRDSILSSPQKSACQLGSDIFPEGLSGFNYLDCSDILKDDDLMSMTSTENEGSLTGVQFNRDALMNLNLNDSTSLAKIQEHLRESRQKLEKEKNQRTLIENQYRVLQDENNKLHKKIEALIQEKTTLEETKISLEAKIRNIQYKLAEETDKSKEAELLLEQSKKQLEKIDQQCKKDFEIKQQTDHTLYQTEMELKRAKHSIEALEAENEELNSQFKNLMHGGILKQQEQLHQLQQQLQSQQQQQPDEVKGFANESLQEVTQLKEENSNLKNQISKLQLEKNNANLSESREFLLKIEELQLEKRQAESVLQECKHKHELEQHTLTLEKRQLNDSVAKLQMQRDKLQEDYIQAQVQYESARQETSTQKELQRNVEQLFQTKIQELEIQNAKWKQEVEKEQTTNKELKEHHSSLQTKVAKLEKELKDAESNLQYQMAQLEDARHNKEQFEQENDIQIYSLQEEKKSLEKDVHNLEIKKSGLEIELNHAKNKVNMLQKDLDLLQQNNIGNNGYLVEELQTDNAKLIAEVQHEKQKCSLLEQQLIEEQNARYTLDANLKEANLQLEKSVLCNEADEVVEPVLTKTSADRDMIQPEDRQQLRHAFDQQKRMENKFEAELEKNAVLQTEITSLKSNIKKKKEHWVAQLDHEKKRLKMQIERERQKANEAVEHQKAVEVLLDAEVEKNHVLQCEILNTKSKITKKQHWAESKLSSSLPIKSFYNDEDRYQPSGSLTRQSELDSYLRTELGKKLEEVNNYLEQQHQDYEMKMAEKENRLTAEKNKLQDEVFQLRLDYEKTLSSKEQQAKEALHFRDLYHHELFLKEMKGNLPAPPTNHHMLYIPTSMAAAAAADPNFANNSSAFKLWEKQPGVSVPSPDFNGSFLHSTAANFSSLNLGPKSQGVPGGSNGSSSTTNTEYSEMLSRWKNEMHRSIKRHLEAPPHDPHPDSTFISTLNQTYPSPIRNPSNQPLTVASVSSSLTKSKAEFLSLLNRKYCL